MHRTNFWLIIHYVGLGDFSVRQPAQFMPTSPMMLFYVRDIFPFFEMKLFFCCVLRRSGVASDGGGEAGRHPDALPPRAGHGLEGRHAGC